MYQYGKILCAMNSAVYPRVGKHMRGMIHVKYLGGDYALHLKAALETKYRVTTYW